MRHKGRKIALLLVLLFVMGMLSSCGMRSDMMVAYHREEIREISLLKAEIEELKRK